jgi:hypothetical protein
MRLLLRPGGSHAIAVMALFVALGTSAYASTLISGKDVRDASLTGRDIRAASLTGREIRNGSLTHDDFRAGGLRAGAPGPKGAPGPGDPKGDTGAAGPAGAPGATSVVVRYTDDSGTGQIDGVASCHSGERAVGGGFDAAGNGGYLTTYRDGPYPPTNGAVPTGWTVTVGSQTNINAPMSGRDLRRLRGALRVSLGYVRRRCSAARSRARGARRIGP